MEGQALLDVVIDREALSRYGIPMATAQETVAAAIGGQEAGEIFEGDRRFSVVVRLPEELRTDLDSLRALRILLPGEKGFVTLGAVAQLDIKEGLNQISREDGKRRVVVQANVRGRDLGSFVEEAQQQNDRESVIQFSRINNQHVRAISHLQQTFARIQMDLFQQARSENSAPAL